MGLVIPAPDASMVKISRRKLRRPQNLLIKRNNRRGVGHRQAHLVGNERTIQEGSLAGSTPAASATETYS